MDRRTCVVAVAALVALVGQKASAFTPPTAGRTAWVAGRRAAATVPRAFKINYDDPIVKAEWEKLQEMEEWMVDQEMDHEFRMPPQLGMSETDKKLMLLELRLRMSGYGKTKSGGSSNKLQTALEEKPALKKLLDSYWQKQDVNRVNILSEYVMDAELAKSKYTTGYDDVFAAVDDALNTSILDTMKSGRITFSGFPAMMGEGAIRASLSEFGELKEFTVEIPLDPSEAASGSCEFVDIEAAKSTIAKWDGVDMGMGVSLTLKPF